MASYVLSILIIALLHLLRTFSNKLYFNIFSVTTENLLFIFSMCVQIPGKLALTQRNALGEIFAEISHLFSSYTILLIKIICLFQYTLILHELFVSSAN